MQFAFRSDRSLHDEMLPPPPGSMLPRPGAVPPPMFLPPPF